MRPNLGSVLITTVLAAGVLTGCGTDTTASDSPGSTSTPGGQSSAPSGGDGDFTEVALVSRTNAGGEVSSSGTELTDAAALASFAQQFDDDAMGRKLASTVAGADVPAGQALVGAVVSIGCDVPPGVSVQLTDDGVVITPLKVASPMKECFAPVTTVAVVQVAADAV